MAWFLNHYACVRCHRRWSNDWSCTCDDDCPQCNARHMSPVFSEDLTDVVEKIGEYFVALRSPDTAEHDPGYVELGRFGTNEQAAIFLSQN